MRSFFLAANSGPSGAEPSRAESVTTARRLSSDSPPESAAIRFTASACVSGMPAEFAVARANRSRSEASGRGRSIAVTAGQVTSRELTSESASARRTMATLTRRRSGLVAQASSRTNRPAPPFTEAPASPAGARYWA